MFYVLLAVSGACLIAAVVQRLRLGYWWKPEPSTSPTTVTRLLLEYAEALTDDEWRLLEECARIEGQSARVAAERSRQAARGAIQSNDHSSHEIVAMARRWIAEQRSDASPASVPVPRARIRDQ